MIHRARATSITAAALTAVVGLAGCGASQGSTGGNGGDDNTVTLVAYSTPQGVYEQLIPAFQETPAGEGVEFEQSYDSSGASSRAVESGLPADIVALSLQPDVAALVDAGIVPEDWAEDKYDGMVSRSVVTFAVRPGNPKNINGWEDLIRDDVEVITPNPITSGGARWNIMAAYGHITEQGGSRAKALDYLRQMFQNVSVLDPSARESVQTFNSGKGDVLITYENEVITAQNNGVEVDYVTPNQTILIENPIAVTESGGEAAEAFVEFARKPSSQKVFAEAGYRPILTSVLDRDRFPKPDKLFTIDAFGGWDTVQTKFFDPQNGLAVELLRELGKAEGG